jgi:hypothetical protein
MLSKDSFIVSFLVWVVSGSSAVATPSVNVSVSSSEAVLASVANPAGSLDGIFSFDLNFSAGGVFRIVPGSIVQPGVVRQ